MGLLDRFGCGTEGWPALSKYFASVAAAVGAIVPLALLLVSRLSGIGWWPSWTLILWPPSYMLLATGGRDDAGARVIVAIAWVLNICLYAIVGLGVWFAYKLVRGWRQS
jgi:hypothetical protein